MKVRKPYDGHYEIDTPFGTVAIDSVAMMAPEDVSTGYRWLIMWPGESFHDDWAARLCDAKADVAWWVAERLLRVAFGY